MSLKRKKTPEEMEERRPELRKDKSTVKTPPIDSGIASEIHNREKASSSSLSHIFCKKRKQVCDWLVPSQCKGNGSKHGSKKDTLNIPSDLIPEILHRLPADVLYNSLKFVSKSWHNMINNPNFINQQARNSAFNGLLASVYTAKGPCAAYFLEFGSKNGKPRKIFELPGGGMIINSCDGLVLIREGNVNAEQYRVLNPLTSQEVIHALPKTPEFGGANLSGQIERARLSGKYKVVHAYSTPSSPIQYEISILTLGVDSSWRRVELGEGNGTSYFFSPSMIAVGGFVYWLCLDTIRAIDVEDETIHQIRLPIRTTTDSKIFVSRYIKSENFLVVVFQDGLALPVFDFWALVNPKAGVWRQLYQVKLNVKKERNSFCSLIKPFGVKCNGFDLLPSVVANDDKVIFSALEGTIFCGYDVKTREFFRYGSRKRHTTHGVLHRQTMVAI